MKSLTLVIPAKNEKDCLPTVLTELNNFDCKKIIIIPKTDLNTQNAVKNLDCKIVMQDDDGFGSALIQGIKETETKFLCIFNADGSMDPKYLKNMFNELSNNCDFVLWLNLAKKSVDLAGLNKPLMFWRQTPNSLSSSILQKLKDAFKVYHLYEKKNFFYSIFCVIRLSTYALFKKINLY